MKIAMIGLKGLPAVSGGIERHVEEIGKRLVQTGHEVTVYCRSTYHPSRQPEYEGIRLRFIKTPANKNLEAIVYTFKATLDALVHDFDIFHYHAIGPASLSFIPWLAGKKTVVTVHGLDWQRDKWGKLAKIYLKWGERAAAIFPRKIISVSKNLQRYYIEKYHKRPEEVVYIPNGVNIQPLKEAAEIKKWGLEKDGYILFLARLVPEKGAHYLIEAYKKLQTPKKLVVAGGASYTDDYVNRLTESAAGSSGIIFTGSVQGRLLDELYSNAYLYVLPSDIEGMPLTLLEAMSYKRCCLVSDIPENAGVVKETLGMTFEKGSIHALQSKLAFLLQDPGLVAQMGERAYREIEENYNWDRWVGETVKGYQSVF